MFGIFLDCKFEQKNLIVGSFGVITSPNYPKNYPPGLRCEWSLEVTLHVFKRNFTASYYFHSNFRVNLGLLLESRFLMS